MTANANASTKCQACGRTGRHCTECGSTNCFGLASKTQRVTLDGVEREIRFFRCRRCTTIYSSDSACNAEPVGVTKALRELKQAKISDEQVIAVLNLWKTRPQARATATPEMKQAVEEYEARTQVASKGAKS